MTRKQEYPPTGLKRPTPPGNRPTVLDLCPKCDDKLRDWLIDNGWTPDDV